MLYFDCDTVNFIMINNKASDYPFLYHCIHERFGDPNGVIKIRKSKDRQYTGQKKKGQIMIYRTLHSKLRLNFIHFNIYIYIGSYVIL
jgi:hypothetical protein